MSDALPVHAAGPAGGSLRRLTPRLVALILALLPAVPASAQTLTLKAEAGLDGYLKPGCWLPLSVLLENAGDEVEGVIHAKTGRPPAVVSYLRPVRLATGARQRHTLYVRLDRMARSAPLSFRGIDADVPVRDLEPDDRLVLSVSDDRSGLSFVQGIKLPQTASPGYNYGPGMGGPNPTQHTPQAYVAHTDAPGLSDSSLAYSSVDVIALGSASLRALAPAQKTALKEWAQDGGTLVVSGGSEVGRLRDPALAELLPVEGLAPQPMASLQALGTRFGSPIAAGSAVVARGRPRAGARVWVAQDGVPLIVSRAYGSGSVLFLAFDYDQAPVRGWAGQMTMWREFLAGADHLQLLRAVQNSAAYAKWNYSYGPPASLAASVADVPAMDLPEAGTIGFFFLTYLLCLVPLNYLVLRRLDRREYAWATTPAIVLVFCIAAYFIGYSSRGGSVQLFRLEVLECGAGSDKASGSTFLGLFSPRRTEYALEADGSVGIREASAQPNTGAYYGGSPQASTGPYTVVQTDKTRVDDIEMNMWSMRVFEAAARRNLGGSVESLLTYGPTGLEGRLVNGTRERLEGGVLVIGQNALKIGPMGPGGDVQVNPNAAAPSQPGAPRGYGYGGGPRKPGTGPPRDRIRDSAVAAVRSMITALGGAPQPVLIAWGRAGDRQVRLERARPQETALALFIFHLSPPAAGAGGGIPPMPGRVVACGPGTNVYPDGDLYISSGSYVDKEFVLPAGALRGRRLVVQVNGRWMGGTGRLMVSLRDPRTGGWASRAMGTGKLTVPDGARFVDGASGRIRLRLEAAGNTYRLSSFEVSAESR